MDEFADTILPAVAFIALFAGQAYRQALKAKGKVPTFDETRIFCQSIEQAEHTQVLIHRYILDALLLDIHQLSADTHFVNDLRVPPGELITVLEDFGEHFRIATPEDAETFGDLLDLILVDPTRPPNLPNN